MKSLNQRGGAITLQCFTCLLVNKIAGSPPEVELASVIAVTNLCVFGVTECEIIVAELLKVLVGAWGFEPQTPTVSSSALPWANSFRINKH